MLGGENAKYMLQLCALTFVNIWVGTANTTSFSLKNTFLCLYDS